MNLTFIIILFLLFNFVCMVSGALMYADEVRGVPDFFAYNIRYLFSDYFNFLANFLFGKKYYVKVNGVWSAWRGRRQKNRILIIRYGVDKHRWEISDENYKICKESNKERIQQNIIDLNIRDLQSSGPSRNELRTRFERLDRETLRILTNT